jgi:very-short-patch-repair endonuclease
MTTPRDFARALRKAPSRAERALWELLRDRRAGAKFRRQHPVAPYTADFACVEARLIVEVDGLSHDVSDQVSHDERRSACLAEAGWRVLRVRDTDVLSEPQRVLDRIKQML